MKLYGKFDVEPDVVENMYSEDIAEQIKEVAGDKLIDYYTKYLKELKTQREIRQVFVEEDTLYSALLYVYRTYIGN